MKTIAEFIPSKARGVIYSLIGTYMALDLIWHFTPDGYEGRVNATLGVLGFGLAVLNTDLVPEADWEPGDRGESTLMTLVLIVLCVVLCLVLLRMIGI